MRVPVGVGGRPAEETAGFEELLRRWDGEQVVIRYDHATGAWMFVCMHSSRLGPATGGTRMRVYPSIGARLVSADAVFDEPCDVFAPCAIGGIINADTIPRLSCRVVAGSANNQLAESEDAERLRARGVLYAPDYVINAGGILQGVGIEALHWTRALLEERLEGIGETLRQNFPRGARRWHHDE